MNFFALALQAVVSALFIALGITQMRDGARLRELFTTLRLTRAVRLISGALELTAGMLMLASVAQPFLAFFAAVFIAVLTLIALVLFSARGAARATPYAGGMLIVVAAIAFLQPLGLRVLSLPKADQLPTELALSATVVKTYSNGTWFESVRAAPDGTLYMTTNNGEDFASGDKSRVVAQVIARSPEGVERVLFALPAGATAGVLALSDDGTLYMTSDGAARGVWRIIPSGKGVMIAELPPGAWGNGIELGPDGHLYVADARLGVIWQVNPLTGSVSKAFESDLLKPRAFVALAPGANGLHFVDRDLYVTVSDAGQVLRMRLDANGKLGALTVIARGIPGDDFAVDDHGTLYITTHPYNTIVRLTADGKRVIVADASQHVIGATDAAFGTRADGTQTLYVVTDGGAFSSGDRTARGTLVALTLPPSR